MVEEGEESCGKWLREGRQLWGGHVLDAVAHQHGQEAMVGRRPGGVNDIVQLGVPLQVDD